MISSQSVGRSTPPYRRPGRRRRTLPGASLVLLVSAALSGAFGGCGRDAGDSRLVLALAPDATCATAPVGCVNELHVVLEDEEGLPRGVWTLPFDVTDGSAPLGDVPRIGSGRFVATGRAAIAAAQPVTVFAGASAFVNVSSRKNQRVDVPVACEPVPDPCASASPTPTSPFNRFPSGSAADALVGQAAYDVCDQNAVNADDGAVREPDGLVLTPTRLWVAGRNDGRIAVFDRGAIGGTLPVDLLFGVGHNTAGENGQGEGPDDFERPRGMALTATTLYVADTENHRVHLYEPLPAGFSDDDADLVVGQDNPGDANQNDGGPDEESLNAPWSVLPTAVGLFVSDTDNHRLLHYPLPVAADKPPADATCGQANFTSIQPNRGAGTPSRNSMSSPAHVATDGTRLYLADRGNHRVLVWESLADAAAGLDPDLVLGQPDFNSNLPNRGGAPGAGTLSGPRGVAATPERLVVADSDNHRVLIWQPPPATDGQPATEVLGQPDFTTVGPNATSATGGTCAATDTCPGGTAPRPDADTLFRPGAAWLEGDELWVSDTCNHRVLRYSATQPPG